MNAIEDRVRSIFLAALELSAGERSTFLEDACGDDNNLRARADELLRAHNAMGSIHGGGPLAAPLEDSPIVEGPGTMIGPYKLVEQIGEGGMGVVYLAEQEQPVRRKVALKIVKPGMDTREVIGRFEAERQALAMMDHPNIAKVFDAGTVGEMRNSECGLRNKEDISEIPHSAGRPFFVMELVQGVPITEYCDNCQLTTRDRLELFVTVCRAVQHAHQKGIIHRDIKPTNVLVAMQDGRPTPKIIDFGVAKAIGGRLTERTLTSGFAQMLGTPLYMSPEQAELSPLGVDTRSDVYALGVLLYELLTGATPFDKDRLHSAPYDEVRRIIREEEPPRPSARISTLAADAATTIAARRRTDTRRLVQIVCGELDWIVMKAIDKDRNRRYESASVLAADVERYLADEPVHARPASRAYRANKFIRRHRAGVVAAAAVLISAATGGVLATIGFARAVQQRDIAESERDVATAERERATAMLHKACETINGIVLMATWRLERTPQTQVAFDLLLDECLRFHETLDEATRMDPVVATSHAEVLLRLANARWKQGADNETPARRAIRIMERLADTYTNDERVRQTLAKAYRALAADHEEELRWSHAEHLFAMTEYRTAHAIALHRLGRLRDAETQFRSDLAGVHVRFDEVMTRRAYALLLTDLGRHVEALEQTEMANSMAWDEMNDWSEFRAKLIRYAWIGFTTSDLARHRIRFHQPEVALREITETLAILLPIAAEVPDDVFAKHLLGEMNHVRALALTALGRFEEAIEAHRRSREYWIASTLTVDRYLAAESDWRIGELLDAQGNPNESVSYFEAAAEHFDAITEQLPDEPYIHERPITFLCTCPIESIRNPHRAAVLAERFATEQHGPMWRYLGLARYRAGDVVGAEEAVRKSMRLRNGGDAIDGLLLAAVYRTAGNSDQAQEAYAKAQAALAEGEPIYYGHIGVLGFRELLDEVNDVFDEAVNVQ